MATITAPSGTTHATPARSSDPPARPLWQVPVFVVGVAALAAMVLLRPFAPASPEQKLVRELAQAREILEPDGDAQRALELANNALREADDYPERIAEAAFLAGEAQVRLAEHPPQPSRAEEAWRLAQQYLERARQAHAEKASLPDADLPRLGYLLGKAGYYIPGENIDTVIGRLAEGTPRVVNRAEGYSLLVQAYLRKQPPDLAKALEYNRKLRDVTDNADLDKAKVQGGELLLLMGKPDEARRSLGTIPDQGPPELQATAKLLRARSYQDEKKWGDALGDYQTALADSRASIPDLASVYYNLGICYRRREQPKEAASAWQECVKSARGDEGPAAALMLAEVRLLEASSETAAPAREEAHERALKALISAVAKVCSPADWHNPLVGKPGALKIFESAADTFRKAGRFDLATQLVEPYSRLAPPLAVLELRATVAADWAAAKIDKFRASNAPAELEKEAIQSYAQAAEAYGEAAAQPRLKPGERAKYLWASFLAYQSAKDPVKGVDRLEKIVKLETDKEKLCEAYYHLGEIHHQGKDARNAVLNFRLCINQGENNKYAYYAHYQLAKMAWEEGRPDEALLELTNNLKRLSFETDPVALAQSLFFLVDIYYKRSDYPGVCRYLESSLARFKEDPAFKVDAEVTQARFQLADSYRKIADRDLQHYLLEASTMSAEAQAHHRQEYRRRMLQAAEEFSSLDAFLNSEAGKDQLTHEQRTQVPFIAAKCWFSLGENEYDKALAIYERLIVRYPDQPEGLEALGGAVQCHAAKGELANVKQRLLQIRYLLPKMPSDIRKEWEKWADQATKELQTLPAGAEG